MTAYRRAQVSGATRFFTVSLVTDKVGRAMNQE